MKRFSIETYGKSRFG